MIFVPCLRYIDYKFLIATFIASHCKIMLFAKGMDQIGNDKLMVYSIRVED